MGGSLLLKSVRAEGLPDPFLGSDPLHIYVTCVYSTQVGDLLIASYAFPVADIFLLPLFTYHLKIVAHVVFLTSSPNLNPKPSLSLAAKL